MEEKLAQYSIVKSVGSDEELEKYRQCFILNDLEKSLDILIWMHQQNLSGLNSIYYAIDKKTQDIAATYAYLPVMVKCMNEIVTGSQAIDALTDYRHRSKGLFIKLASKLEKEEGTKRYQLVYGFPNGNSIHAHVKKLGFTYFGEVPFLIKPFRISYLINKILKKTESDTLPQNCTLVIPPFKLKGAEIKEITEFDEEYDRFYSTISPQINIGINRNSAYMNWRYIAKPGEIYSRYGLYENSRLTGVVVFALKNKHGGKVGYLMELLYDPKNHTNAGNHLLEFSSLALKKNNADVVLAWCFDHSFNYTCFRRNGYYKFPEKLRPQKLGFITKVLNGRNTKDIYNIKNWYLSYSDSDTV